MPSPLLGAEVDTTAVPCGAMGFDHFNWWRKGIGISRLSNKMTSNT